MPLPSFRVRRTAAACAVAVASAAIAIPAFTVPASAVAPSEAIDGVFVTIAHAQGDEVFAEHGHASDQDFIVTDSGALVPVELPAGVEVAAGAQVEATATATTAPLIDTFEDGAQDPTVEAAETEVQLETVTVVAQAEQTRDGATHAAYVVAVDDPRDGTDVPLSEAISRTERALTYWMDEADGAIGDFFVADAQAVELVDPCAGYETLWRQTYDLFPDADFYTGRDHLVVYTPERCSYGYAGIASVGGRLDGGVVHIAFENHHTVVHEVGHNLSLLHSNLSYEKNGAWKEREYFGFFGPMSGSVGVGYEPGAVGASQRYFLDLPGARDSTEQMLIEMGMGDTRTVTLNPIHADTGTTAVRLRDSATGETFFVEYRAGTGKDAGTYYEYAADRSFVSLDGGRVAYAPGVLVSQYDEDGAVSVLTTLTDTDRWAATLPQGGTFVDVLDRFEITAGPATGGGVDVTITTGGPRPSPFGEEIDWLRDNGISTNWADGTFRPLGNVTRDAMAAFLYRLAGEPEVALPAQSPFVDVTPTSTEFYEEIVWLSDQGITAGWDTSRGTEFRPESRITRDAMAAFLYRYADSDAVADGSVSFTDVTPTSTEFYNEISWMAQEGISTGWSDGTFRPFEPVTREAMAAFLYRLAA